VCTNGVTVRGATARLVWEGASNPCSPQVLGSAVSTILFLPENPAPDVFKGVQIVSLAAATSLALISVSYTMLELHYSKLASYDPAACDALTASFSGLRQVCMLKVCVHDRRLRRRLLHLPVVAAADTRVTRHAVTDGAQLVVARRLL